MPTYSAGVGAHVVLQDATTTGNGNIGMLVPALHNPRIHIRGLGTITGGTVIIEEASDPAYTGTWSTLYTITATTLSVGAEQVIHILGSLGAVRARISSNIVGGGTITAELVGG